MTPAFRDLTPTAVVIPFYQREQGLLRRAIDSVARQTGLDGRLVHVIVVDDASPSPPMAELEDLVFQPGMMLQIITQANGGPGSARNAGIDRAGVLGCAAVAFLDSDDFWEAEHLAVALKAMELAPFYFANSSHDGVPSFSYFMGMNERIDESVGIVAATETFALILNECVPHTSQVVYSLQSLPDIRFDETMQRTGEDHLFWLTVASRGMPMAYTSQIMGHRGRGVSVYREALAWDSSAFVSRLIDAFNFRSKVEATFSLSPAEAEINARHRQKAADEIAFALARWLARSPSHLLGAINEVAREGPMLWRAIATAVPRLRSIRRGMTA